MVARTIPANDKDCGVSGSISPDEILMQTQGLRHVALLLALVLEDLASPWDW